MRETFHLTTHLQELFEEVYSSLTPLYWHTLEHGSQIHLNPLQAIPVLGNMKAATISAKTLVPLLTGPLV